MSCYGDIVKTSQEMYPLTNAPMLLWLAHVILVDNGHLLKSSDVSKSSYANCCHGYHHSVGLYGVQDACSLGNGC